MKFLLSFLSKIVLFLLLLFVFLVLFQYGPSGFLEGARSELDWFRSLLPNDGETSMMPDSQPAGNGDPAPPQS
jgi:hypothetical protein